MLKKDIPTSFCRGEHVYGFNSRKTITTKLKMPDCEASTHGIPFINNKNIIRAEQDKVSLFIPT